MGLDLRYVPGVTVWDPVRRLYVLDLAQFEMRSPVVRRRRVWSWLRRRR